MTDIPDLVWGCPSPVLPLLGFPPGKVRLRFRQDDLASAWVKDAAGIRRFYLIEWNGHWIPGPLIAQNSTPMTGDESYKIQKQVSRMTMGRGIGVYGWKTMGSFPVNEPCRDGTPPNNRNMALELEGFRKTWPGLRSRVLCPDGTIIE